jgi:23S rRNA pseudouridine2605 synthase
MASVRLQKVLAHAGVASRRAAEELISSGRVRVDGQVVTELGTKVDPRRSRVEVDGRRVVAELLVYIVLHKPRSVVSTMNDPEGRPTVRDLFTNVAGRVYPIGRLDFATSGVLLATNDGDFAEGLMHPRKGVPKTYVIKVQGEMAAKDLDAWRDGVELEDGKTLPAKVKLLRHEGDKTWFQLTITEGRNQQVRRMGDATGFRVMRLARTEFAGIGSEGLRPGEWRYLTADELMTMKADFGVPRRAVTPPRAPPKPSTEPVRPPRDTARARRSQPSRDGRPAPSRSARETTRSAAVRSSGPAGVRERPPGRPPEPVRGGPNDGGASRARGRRG